MYFSIIMPTYNRSNIINQAIDSIIGQNFKDWELIIVDDHGTDSTREVISQIKDSRIKYFYLKKNCGPGLARDFGIKKADGKIIVLTDSDDINCPNRLQLTYDEFQNRHSSDIIYARSDRLDTKGTISHRPTCDFNPELLKYYNFISNVTTAFRKECFLRTKGYDPRLRTSEDYDLWLTFLEQNYKFAFIDRSLVLQKIHPQSVTSQTDFEERKKNLAYVRQKHHLNVPKPEQVKKIVDQELWNFIYTPRGQEFWFGIKA